MSPPETDSARAHRPGSRTRWRVTAFAALAATAACRPPSGPLFAHSRHDAPPRELVYNNGSEPETLDPGLATGHPDARIISNLFDGLTEFHGEDLSPLPGTAESWDTHADGRGYTFHLRPDATWSDGTPLTAHDYAWSWERVLDPVVGARYARQLFNIRNARDYHRRRLYRLASSTGGLPEGTPVEVTRSFALSLVRDTTVLRSQGGGEVAHLPARTLVTLVDQREGWRRIRFRPSCPDLADPASLLDCREPPVMGWVPAEAVEETIPLLDARVVTRRTVLASAAHPEAEPRGVLERGQLVFLRGQRSGQARVLLPESHRRGWVPLSHLDNPAGEVIHLEVRAIAPQRWERDLLGRDTGDPEATGDPLATEPVIALGSALELDPHLLGLRAWDDHTLEVRLERVAPYFLYQTSQITLRATPRHTIAQWGDRWTRPEHIVTSGPFRLAEHRLQDRFVLEKDPTWWGAPEVFLERVVAWSIEDVHTSVNLYRAGETDLVVANELPNEFIPILRDKGDFHEGPAFATLYLEFNTRHTPLEDPRIRRALALAVDAQEVSRALHAGHRPAHRLVPPYIPGYPELSEDSGTGAYDPAAARGLLSRAGYPVTTSREGGARIVHARGFPILTFLYNTQATNRLVAAVLQNQWKQHLGIEVRLEARDWTSYLDALDRGEFDIARASWIGDYLDPQTFLDPWVSGGGLNHTGWSSPRYDDLVLAAEQEPDPWARLTLFSQAEALLLEEAPILPLFWYSWTSLRQPAVKGWETNLLDRHPLRHVSLHRGGGS